MGLKAKIKNDMWHINYIIPFTAKYLQGGKLNYIKKSLPIITKLRVIKGKGKRDISSDIVALMKAVDIEMLEDSSFSYWLDEHKTIAVRGNILSNFSLDYNKLVNSSFNAAADAAIKAGGIYGERASDIKKAITILCSRTKQAIEEKCTDEHKKKRLVSEFDAMLKCPAVHFHEGLQRILFFHQYMWQTRHGLNGFGRLDKILGHLYNDDIKAGIITKKSALNMIQDFMNAASKWYEYKSSSLLGDIGQIVVLGGMEPDGTYFCNDLTYLFLEAQSGLKKPDPKTLVRIGDCMPEGLMEAAVRALPARTGSPLFSNDDVVIPQLEQFGISHDDACGYCVSACWEPFIPGKSSDQNNIKAFDFYRPLSMALNGTDLTKIIRFEDVIKLYEKVLRREWRKLLRSLDEYIWACDPFVSMLTDGCNESTKDISQGGAKYNNYGVTSIGMGSVCDSLLNIKRYVFDEKRYSLADLNAQRKVDFKDNKEMYAILKSSGHSFAHDDERAEALVNRIIAVSNEEAGRYTNPMGGKVKFGLSSPFYIRDAKDSPADFAGRKTGDPYGTHISCTDASYTETVIFAGKIDYGGHAFNGNVVDYFLSPGLIENNIKKFTAFMKASVKTGFFQMQMNIMDSATLIDAKAHPEKYPGLIVRVWGFSAYYNDLPEDYKNVLIQRAVESEKAA